MRPADVEVGGVPWRGRHPITTPLEAAAVEFEWCPNLRPGWSLARRWKQFGRPSGLFIDRHDVLWVTDYQSDVKINPGFRRGITYGSAKDGQVTGFIPDPDATASQEGIAVDTQGNVYSALTGGRVIRKYAKP